MRTANAARALLLRVQAARHKRDSVQDTREQDAWTTHAAEGLLLAADSHAPAPPPPDPHRPRRPPPTMTTNSPATTRPSSTP